jgi:hypothetical protein
VRGDGKSTHLVSTRKEHQSASVRQLKAIEATAPLRHNSYSAWLVHPHTHEPAPDPYSVVRCCVALPARGAVFALPRSTTADAGPADRPPRAITGWDIIAMVLTPKCPLPVESPSWSRVQSYAVGLLQSLPSRTHCDAGAPYW